MTVMLTNYHKNQEILGKIDFALQKMNAMVREFNKGVKATATNSKIVVDDEDQSSITYSVINRKFVYEFSLLEKDGIWVVSLKLNEILTDLNGKLEKKNVASFLVKQSGDVVDHQLDDHSFPENVNLGSDIHVLYFVNHYLLKSLG